MSIQMNAGDKRIWELGKNMSGKEQLLAKCITDDGILDIQSLLKETDDIALVIDILMSFPLTNYEVAKQFVVKNDLKGLFKYVIDNDLKVPYNVFAEENADVIFDKALSAILANSHTRKNVNKAIFSKYREVEEDDLSRFREALISDLRLQDDKKKTVGYMDRAYFNNLLNQGQFRHACIDVCAKLEAILRADYKYAGNLEEMINAYFDKYLIDDGWGYRARNKKMEDMVHRVRMFRNNALHSNSDGTSATPPSNGELIAVIDFVLDIERDQRNG